ncbi:MAG: hypothetical protein ABSG69_18345 [Candidatus Acidiferrum sp.]|jgi:hypothetical protein
MPLKENKTDATLEAAAKRPINSLDTWAVIFALVAGALIRAGVIKHIPW